MRHYEVPEIIRVTSPLYLNTRSSVVKTHGWETTAETTAAETKQCGKTSRTGKKGY